MFSKWLVLLIAVAGCEAGSGRAQVFIEAEDSVTAGLKAGTAPEDVQDGWNVTYQKFLVAVGNFRAARSAEPGDVLAEPKVVVVDLKNLPSGGYVFATFDGARAARWDKVGFDLPNATAMAMPAPFTAPADHERMVQGGWSVYLEATLEKEGRTHVIRWGIPAGTAFDDCAPAAGDSGFAVPAGGTAQVKPTIHGDHWFFSTITAGEEITQRRAQWIIDSDVDGDGETTIEELKQTRAADVFTPPTYNLTGAVRPIVTAYDYLVAQASTLGDFQGDGECPTRRPL